MYSVLSIGKSYQIVMLVDLVAIAQKWNRLLEPFQVEPKVSQKLLLNLVATYSSGERFYHNLEHIWQVLQTIEGMRSLAEDFAAIEFSAWFHDIIYNPKAKDNEEKSAAYAAEILPSLFIPSSTIEKVSAIILATKSHQVSDKDIDSKIFLDADLAILGASEADYRAYAQLIRQEYSYLSEQEYRRGRTSILQNFLNRSIIYLTQPMFVALEDRARANITAEIEMLSE